MYVIWYIAAAIDGRIAGAGDDMSFLESFGAGELDDPAAEFESFVSSIDAVVIGGATMRWLEREGHGLPHQGLPIWLVSRDRELAARATTIDEATLVERVEGPLDAIFEQIAHAGHERVWICGGGDIAGQALAADLIDEVVLTIAPTVLGSGPAIFDAPQLEPRAFRLAECRPYGDGNAVRLRWKRSH